MDKLQPSRLVYPIQIIQIGDFPLLDELVNTSENVTRRVGFDSHSGRHFRQLRTLLTRKSVFEYLERALASDRLEPLASLTYSLIPSNTQPAHIAQLNELLLPYQQHVENKMKDLLQNTSFEVQMTPDNTWGNIILANGLIIMKSGGNYIAYRYSVKSGLTSSVFFERLPDLKSQDLETTIKKYHNPKSIESPVLVRSRKPYHTKEDMLPFFAYSLTGLKK